jgi:N-glycosidase YbiA
MNFSDCFATQQERKVMSKEPERTVNGEMKSENSMAEMTGVINFYSVVDEFGEFSNFAPYPFKLDGDLWPTVEHYFQAQKFEDKVYKNKIRKSNSPMLAARMGRDRKQKLRRDWESVKVGVMRAAVLAKFTQHEDLSVLLLSTGEFKLVEQTENDNYWGDGGDGSGKNMLGRILMQVRESLRLSQDAKQGIVSDRL